MIVISDTTPLNYLRLIEEENILHQLFGQVVIPQAVFNELQAAETPASMRMWIASRPAWLAVKPVSLAPDVTLMHLDAGEQEAILLAQELQADLVIMDDREAKAEALKRSLPVVGTLGILERAAEKGLIDFPQVLAQLKRTSFYISDALERSFLKRDAVRKLAERARHVPELPTEEPEQKRERDKGMDFEP